MSMTFKEYPDREMLGISLADQIASQLAQNLRSNETASFCAAGGTTPIPVYQTLSGTELDWDRVTVFPSDERWVDGEHNRSNARLLRRHLLVDKAAGANYIDFYTGQPEPEEAEVALAEALVPHFPITVGLLGMGDDMHTASLFPGADNLALALANDAPPVMAIRAPGAAEPRLTLTKPPLVGAMALHILIFGKEKREAVERAQKLDPIEAPVRAVLDLATVHWAE